MAESNQYFLKIEGLPGEATDKALPDSMELISWRWGNSRNRGGAIVTSTGGKDEYDEIHFMTSDSKASTALQAAAATGRGYSKAELVVAKNSNVSMRAEMQDVVVSGFQLAGVGGGSHQVLVASSILFSDVKVKFTDATTLANQGSVQKPAVVVKSTGS